MGKQPLLVLATDLTLLGAGIEKTILTGAGKGKGKGKRTVLAVGPDATVTLQGLTITGGRGSRKHGGSGGGITNEGDLTLTDCLVTGNRAGFGGGIFNAGPLRLVTSRVEGNRGTEGGGIFNDGPGSFDGEFPEGAGTVTLVDSAVTNNTANTDGGGIKLANGTLLLEGTSSVAGNTAGDDGGGIYILEGQVTLSDASRVSENRAKSGGGISLGYVHMTMKHTSRVDGNEARPLAVGSHSGMDLDAGGRQ